MKTGCSICSARKRRRDGSAVLIIMLLLGLMLIFVGANVKTLQSLRGELKLIERRQIQRIQRVPAIAAPSVGALTNSPASDSRVSALGIVKPHLRSASVS